MVNLLVCIAEKKSFRQNSNLVSGALEVWNACHLDKIFSAFIWNPTNLEGTVKYHINKYQFSIWAKRCCILQSSESWGRKIVKIGFEQKEIHHKIEKETKIKMETDYL